MALRPMHPNSDQPFGPPPSIGMVVHPLAAIAREGETTLPSLTLPQILRAAYGQGMAQAAIGTPSGSGRRGNGGLGGLLPPPQAPNVPDSFGKPRPKPLKA